MRRYRIPKIDAAEAVPHNPTDPRPLKVQNPVAYARWEMERERLREFEADEWLWGDDE